MDLNICSKFIFQRAPTQTQTQTVCRSILATFYPTTVNCFYVNVFQLEISSSVSDVVSTGLVWSKSHLRFCHIQILFIFLFQLTTIILPVVLYGCETWSLTLREERKLRVFENMVLRRIFGPRMDEVTGEWRRLHNEGLNDL